jgi:hypothetical protein
MTIQLNFGAGKNLIPGLIELTVICGNDTDSDLPESIVQLMQQSPSTWTEQERQLVWKHCAMHTSDLSSQRIDLQNYKERLAVLTQPFSTMVMDVAAKPRQTFILARGDYAQPTEPVTAGIPAFLQSSAIAEAEPNDRLGLARWIASKQHPLTARVQVNRVWKMMFGVGLVSTPTDFGSQGEWPSHPELLDWLAVDFMDHDWDIKHLVRQIVTSQAYQRSSHSNQQQLSVDPENRLLARGPRFRMSAEQIRDAALASSGLLVRRVGGPSVNPYTPGDLWREVSHYGSTPATAQAFVQDHGEKLYRRSMYTYWKRTAPPPSMLAFDAPNREVCTVHRASTTTPLQALVTLNDVQFVECARLLAQRIITSQSDTTDRIRFAFQCVLTREPTWVEVDIVGQRLAQELHRFKADPQRALSCLSVGESPRDEAIDPALHAAWMQVASMILNLSESVTRH